MDGATDHTSITLALAPFRPTFTPAQSETCSQSGFQPPCTTPAAPGFQSPLHLPHPSSCGSLRASPPLPPMSKGWQTQHHRKVCGPPSTGRQAQSASCSQSVSPRPVLCTMQASAMHKRITQHICAYCLSAAWRQCTHQERFCHRKVYDEAVKNGDAAKN